MNKKWQPILRKILVSKISDAVNEASESLDGEEEYYFPWIGDNCYNIMADAAINILLTAQDTEAFLIDDDQLIER